MENFVSIAVDLGGTQLRVAAVDNGEILVRETLQTQDLDTKPDSLLRIIGDIIDSVIDKSERAIRGIGLVMPGPCDGNTGVVYKLPNISGWEEKVDVVGILQPRFAPFRISLDNDANAATLAEHQYGAGKGTKEFVYLTVSTGIGGGAVVSGRLQRGVHGTATEFGHMTIDFAGPRCGCGNFGCLEAMASGTAIARMADEEAGKTGFTAKMVYDAAVRGEVWAEAILKGAGQYLGVGLANIANLYDPELIVLGGGVMRAGDYILQPALAELRKRALPSSREVWIQKSQLGDDAGLLGAAALVNATLA